ncbi:uncharacterized protein LOC123310559 [Coccinella septempunctata]|uniref:uncharacterized protein LOC123310559 n=1 Tax=Coccinella septempunctata TaxID=41139 RepID=UPI001D091AA4|nr:uncharacterized protein LOC123310559 [Coccinella septempunctata]
MNLCSLTTEQNFFEFDNTIFCMEDGLSMGSPASGLCADIYVNHVEEKIMSLPYSNKIIVWKRYVDDIFCVWAGTDEELKNFFDTINSKFKIKFTLEKAINNSINFLDLNITLNEDCSFSYDIYRKTTQTDTIIPFHSYHAPPIKRTVFRFLFNRLLNIPLSEDNYRKELKIIYQIGENNEYPREFIDDVLTSIKRKNVINKVYPHYSVQRHFVSIPFYHKFNKKFIQMMNKYNYSVVNKRHKTLENFLINNKPKIEKDQLSGIYKITCSDCPCFYIGMTTRTMRKRFTEHQKNRPNSALGNHLTEQHHGTTLDNLEILHKGNNFGKLTLLEQHEIIRNRNNQHLLNDLSDFEGNVNIFKIIDSA